MANDGIFSDDPTEAVQALDQQVFGKKLMGRAGLELRPIAANPMLQQYAGLQRASASVQMNVLIIWRAYVLKPKGRVAFRPPEGTTPEDAGARLAQVGVTGPGGRATKEAYEFRFDNADTKQLLDFAIQGLRALGYNQQQEGSWYWLAQHRDLVPD
jgi:hypothetical protein